VKQTLKKLLSLSLLISTVGLRADDTCSPCETSCAPTPPCTVTRACSTDCSTVCDFSCNDTTYRCCYDNDIYYNKTHFTLRPQGTNAARHLMGLAGKTNVFGKEDFYSIASVALEYQQTFNRHNDCKSSLGVWFSPNCSNCFVFGPDQNQPTQALNQGLIAATGINETLKKCVDIRSLDFAMSSSHKSRLCIAPKIRSMIADFDFWFGLDACISGLWARLDVPVVWTQWNIETYETELNAGGAYYGCGSLVQCPYTCQGPQAQGTPSAPQIVYKKERDAWCGEKAVGQIPPLDYGKVCCGKSDAFSLSGVRFDFGYDFWRGERGHLGIGAVSVAGVGTKSKAESLFQPVVGAEQAWQIGGTLNASYDFCNRDDRSFTLLIDVTATHLFKHHTQRLFGLKANGPWSQYVLLKKFKTDDTTGAIIFDGFERAANILTGNVKIKNDIMVDAAFAFNYRRCDVAFTLGGEIWYRSRDKIADGCGFGIVENRYAVKGITECDTLTASLSTIGTSKGVGLNNTAQNLPNGVPLDVNDGYTNAQQTTPNIITLKNSDIDVCPGLCPDALTGKVFGSMEYTWQDCEWQPFVVVGAEAEFGRGNSAADQIGLIVKGGLSY
jgi:hypothetical protein